ncbi:MAG: hypothetical protein ACP5PJ_04270, partial [Acidimicrobiales bacterium]
MTAWRSLVRAYPSGVRMLGADAAIIASFAITWLVPGLGFGYFGNALIGLFAFVTLLAVLALLSPKLTRRKLVWRNPIQHRGLV